MPRASQSHAAPAPPLRSPRRAPARVSLYPHAPAPLRRAARPDPALMALEAILMALVALCDLLAMRGLRAPVMVKRGRR